MPFLDRRLPVYLLVDCSSSMTGEPIQAAKQGLSALLLDLRQDFQAAHTAWISVLAFHSAAWQASPLTPLRAFREPVFSTGGSTRTGDAMRLARARIGEEAQSPKAGEGDFRPIVFLFTDGAPADDWEEAAQWLRVHTAFTACGAGAHTDRESLHALAGRVLMLNTLAAGDFQACFAWDEWNGGR